MTMSSHESKRKAYEAGKDTGIVMAFFQVGAILALSGVLPAADPSNIPAWAAGLVILGFTVVYRAATWRSHKNALL